MAAPRLLAKTDLTAHAPVAAEGRAAIEQHGRLIAGLSARGLPTTLFAEPVITRGADGAATSVSWYAEADSDPAPLSSLSPARRAEAERALGAAIAAVLPALDDPDCGALLRRALMVAEPDSVLAVDGRVVLTGWGLVPRGAGSDDAALAKALREGLGRYHPALAAAQAGFFAATAPSAAAAMASSAVEPAAQATPAAPPRNAAPPPPPPLPPVQPSPGPAPRASALWWMLPAALLIALLFLLLGVWLGLRMCTAEFAGRELQASVVEEGQTREAIARQREANSRLEREIAAARAALAGEICRPAGPLPSLAPEGATPGAAPSTLQGEGAAAAPPEELNLEEGPEAEAEQAPEGTAPAPAPR